MKNTVMVVGALALFALASVTIAGRLVVISVDPGTTVGCVGTYAVVEETGTAKFRDAVSGAIAAAATLRTMGCPGAHIVIEPCDPADSACKLDTR